MAATLEQCDDLEAALWRDACIAADIFALLVQEQKFQHAGIFVKCNAGPVRDLWMKKLGSVLPADVNMRPVPNGVSMERLLGGLDLGGTLAAGRTVEMRGLLSESDENILLLPMADLAAPTTVSLIANAMDGGAVHIEREGLSKVELARFAVVAFDESEPGDDPVSRILTDRLMLHIDLRPVSLRTAQKKLQANGPQTLDAALSEEMRAQLCQLAVAFGLTSMRPAMQAVELAKIHCRLQGREAVGENDVAAAVRLGFVHRAEQMPSPQQEDSVEQETEDPADQNVSNQVEEEAGDAGGESRTPEELVSDVVDAFLPAGLLAHLKSDHASTASRVKVGRQGRRTMGTIRGRPLMSRKGELRSGKRLDLIATLRAAAPWQNLRRRGNDNGRMVHIRRSDFCIRRYQQRSETSTIFVVDASGSTALNRLGETKGAIELLLGETYARRDHVALVSFRGRKAEVLLTPTRALARAKRSLASLPGGGGTPLASGLQVALSVAQDEWKRGREPSVIVMTDGSANVDASGAGGRKQAADDAEKVARGIRESGFPAILVDVGRQPKESARILAGLMGATYVPMPFASSRRLSDAVRSCL